MIFKSKVAELREALQEAKKRYRHLSGVKGFGINDQDGAIIIYIKNREVANAIEPSILGSRVMFSVVGDVKRALRPRR